MLLVKVFAFFAVFLYCVTGLSASEDEKFLCLVFDEAEGEEEVCARLERAGITGIICESTAYALVCDFSEVKKTPLSEYRLLDIDPRNDGFAAALRAFFVSSGKRRVFLPAQKGVKEQKAMEAKIQAALSGNEEGAAISFEFFTPEKRLPAIFRPKTLAIPRFKDGLSAQAVLSLAALLATLVLAFALGGGKKGLKETKNMIRITFIVVSGGSLLLLTLVFSSVTENRFPLLCALAALALSLLQAGEVFSPRMAAFFSRLRYRQLEINGKGWAAPDHVRFTALPLLPPPQRPPLLSLPYALAALAALALQSGGR